MTKKKKRERVNYNEKNKHKYWFLDQNIKDLSGTNSTFCGFAIVFKQNSNIVIFAICMYIYYFVSLIQCFGGRSFKKSQKYSEATQIIEVWVYNVFYFIIFS